MGSDRVTLVVRKINLSFSLGTGSFGETGAATVDLEGLRVSAQIARSGGVSLSQLTMRVWGMPVDVMQQLTVLNKLAFEQERNNTVTVTAGDDERGFGVVFSGTIKEAWADATNAPEVCFVVSAFEGLLDKIRPVAPTSFRGTVAVDTIFANIAAQMEPPRAFENSGVDVILDNTYLPGTLVDQAIEAMRQANCNLMITDRILAIWPVGQSRDQNVLDISPETGLVGYPVFTQNGLSLRTLYSPSLTFGQTLNVRSTFTAANGQWVVANVIHSLDSELPGGQWFTSVECGLLGYAAPIIG